MVAKNFNYDVNMGGNEIQNAVFQNLSTEPTTYKKAGRLYFNSADKRFHYYNGTKDVVLGDEIQDLLADVATSGAFSDLTGKPTKLSEFTDDLGTKPTHSHSQYLTSQSLATYSTTEQMNSAIATAIASAGHLKREIVESLPAVADADDKTIYMILASDGKTGDLYNEYMLVNGAFEQIGNTRVDLSGYVPTSRKINGKPLTADINLGADDVGATKKIVAQNPALTASSGVCTWTISNTIASADVHVQVRNASTGEVVEVAETITASTVTIKMNSTSNIAANTYKAVIVG